MIKIFTKGLCNIMKIFPVQNNYNSKRNLSLKQCSKLESVEDRRTVHEKCTSNQYKAYALIVGFAVLIGGIIAAVNIKNKASIRSSKQVSKPKTETTEYMKTLSESMSKYLNKKIEPEQLSCVISGKELLKELKFLNRENYTATSDNIKNGTFVADLHSHSVFSDGKGSVKVILENVAKYADKLNAKNGKKFIFALTDHDGIDGVKEALTIIAETPEKYKNVKFVTGTEVSYIIKSNKTENPYETSELLVYGFNPFDSDINKFFDKIQQRRKQVAEDFIKDLNQKFGYANFTYEEFSKTYLNKKHFLMMNNQWKVHDYAQTKNAVAGLAGFKNRNKEELYAEIMSKTSEKKSRLCDLRKQGLVPQSYGDDSNITALARNKFTPHNVNGSIDFAGENNFNDIVSVFGKREGVFGAFAHPYYINERTTEAKSLVSDLVTRSNGLIKATESYHQAYQPSIDLADVEKFNKEITSANNIAELGGRDNHNSIWLDFTSMD